MNLFLRFIFIFFIGSTLGWIIELFFRRIVGGKWVNPGFLVGPYLPIYGFGLCTLTYLFLLLSKFTINPIIIIFLMGISMTIIEFIGGLCFLKDGIKLWDYSNEWGNFKGIICPLFSLIWTILGAIYYYFIAFKMLKALEWFSNNLSFSFILGLFFGVIVIDYIYSTKLYNKIQKYADDNKIEVKYEEFKRHIKEIQETTKQKYSFLFSFKQTGFLKDYLNAYKHNINIEIKKNRK